MNNMGMRKVLTKGISTANKVFTLTATAYNLKKYMKFITKLSNVKKEAMLSHINTNFEIIIIEIMNQIGNIFKIKPIKSKVLIIMIPKKYALCNTHRSYVSKK